MKHGGEGSASDEPHVGGLRAKRVPTMKHGR
jgi:hypothetical protein